MYITFAVIAAVLLLLWAAVRGRSTQIDSVEAAQQAITPVDIDAFRNLTDASQDRYLQQQLTRPDFRRVQRARSLATADYLWKLASNASVILRVGEFARGSEQERIVQQGAEMASAAVSLRIFCLLGLAQAYAGYVFPGAAVSVGGIADGYDKLTARLWAIRHSWTPVRSAS